MSLQVRGLTFGYPGRRVLAGLSLDIQDGEVAFLLGPSGSGKSTLLRCVAGLERGYTGQVRLGRQALEGVPAHRRGIGLVLQDRALFPHLDVGDNVAFGLRYQDVPRTRRRSEARRWLDLVGLGDRVDDRIQELSGGQQQRVALVRTLAARPRAVLLDEPLSGLDRDLRDEVGGMTRDLIRQEGVPALWVTHDEHEAQRWGDAVWRMEEGRAVLAQARPT